MKNIFKLKESEKDRIRKLHESHKSFYGTSLINEQITSSSSGVDEYGNVTKIETTKAFEFPPEIVDLEDDTKKVWYCMDDHANRGWNMDDDTYKRFQLLYSAIDGPMYGAGTDEDSVWAALAGSTAGGYYKGGGKGKISDDQLQNMLPVLSCMNSDKPWETDYMVDNDLDGQNVYGWILNDFSGEEKCYLQAYMSGGDRQPCDDKHNYFWWNKASNWIKGLF
tara:strand:+ start:3679 stop:4344 length:666 start_codon:yes stop_codon:yes gene_type:complete